MIRTILIRFAELAALSGVLAVSVSCFSQRADSAGGSDEEGRRVQKTTGLPFSETTPPRISLKEEARWVGFLMQELSERARVSEEKREDALVIALILEAASHSDTVLLEAAKLFRSKQTNPALDWQVEDPLGVLELIQVDFPQTYLRYPIGIEREKLVLTGDIFDPDGGPKIMTYLSGDSAHKVHVEKFGIRDLRPFVGQMLSDRQRSSLWADFFFGKPFQSPSFSKKEG